MARNKALKLSEKLQNQHYKILIVVGPSGVGKSTLIKRLNKKHQDTYKLSVSYTTRRPRKGEKLGVDYFYANK